MIKPNKIQEWIQEIEERPLAAPFLVRTLSARLLELDEINESLRAENLTLRTDKKIQEYERRIADLEYQIELLKRQVQGEIKLVTNQAYLLIYDTEGHLLIRDFSPQELASGGGFAPISQFEAPHSDDIHMLAVEPHDELMFVMDSGRVSTQTASELPLAGDDTTWQNTFTFDMRSGERLVTIVPITRAPFIQSVVQVSRKGAARSIKKDLFQSFLASHQVGKGVRSPADAPLGLSLCNSDEVFVVVSHSGFTGAFQPQKLSITLEEIIKLDMKDYLVSAFTIRSDQKLVIALENGDLYFQTNPWQDAQDADGSKRRLLFGSSRSSSVRIVEAVSAAEGSWAFQLDQQGSITVRLIEVAEDGKKEKSLKGKNLANSTIAFTIWQPDTNK